MDLGGSHARSPPRCVKKQRPYTYQTEQARRDLKRAGAVRDVYVQVIVARGSYAPPLFKEEMDGNLNQIVTFTPERER